MTDYKQYTTEAAELLMRLIEAPRTSRNETLAADIMQGWMEERGLEPRRIGNNIVAVAPEYSPERETIMLNAHIDTVKPVASWTRDPHKADIVGDRLYGIGSNDCGGGLVALLQVFRLLRESGSGRRFNLVYVASAEEEVSGAGGLTMVIPVLGEIIPGFNMQTDRTRPHDFPRPGLAIVGEPTGMQPAVAEKGLMVVDMTAHGVSGHAARDNGVNAIYKALDDIQWIRDYTFGKTSELLGPTKMTLTVINAGTQHNVVPDECRMVIDIRTNERYTNEEVFNIIQQHVSSQVKARSFRLSSSSTPLSHPVVRRCIEEGMTPFGSPTLSDQALMPWPSLKLGPGDSARSHSADEYICLSEIDDAIKTYMRILS
ncbi:MAG: M20 family metallo-hydrolase [Prevotella sp.]